MPLREVVEEAIRLSTVVRDEYEASRSGEPFQAIVYQAPRQSEVALREFLDGQSVAYVYALVTLMYFGRDDFDTMSEFYEEYDAMSETFPKPIRAIDQMLEKVPLPEYLENAVRKLNEEGIDVNGLLLIFRGKSFYLN